MEDTPAFRIFRRRDIAPASFNPGLSDGIPPPTPTYPQHGSTRITKAEHAPSTAARHGMQAERIDYGMWHGVHAGMHALSDSTISIDKYNV